MASVPANSTTRDGSAESLYANGSIGPWLASIDVGELSWRDNQNDMNRIVALQPLPSYSTNEGKAVSTSLSMSRSPSIDEDLMVSIDTFSNWSSINSFGFSASDIPDSSRFITDTIEARDNHAFCHGRASLSSDLQFVRNSGSNWVPDLEEIGTLKHGASQWSLTGAIGAQPNYGGSPQQLFSPSFATYDCAGHLILASGAGDAPSSMSLTKLNLEFSRQFGDNSISVAAYNEADRNAFISDALIAAPYDQVDTLPAGYIEGLQEGFSSFGGCSGPPPGPASIYFQEGVGGLTVRDRNRGIPF